MTMTKLNIDQLAINTIKILSIEAVERANSGHPGTPMGLADLGYLLWTRYLRYNPTDPHWPNRDRFILSCGHASMLIYSLLHLAGYNLPLEQIKRFRQLHSQTPGHPEFGVTPGVEVTTGPLGQGLSNAVGLALGAKMSAARFNTPDFSPLDYKVYALASDGDIMEGVQAEAASLAGHLQLDNLIVFYDANEISIAGNTNLTLSEDVGKRYAAYGWKVQHIDGHDHKQILAALDKTQQTPGPHFIVTKTHIAHGAPTKQDTADAHGAPLGAAEISAIKKILSWDYAEEFYVPEEVREVFGERAKANQKIYAQWHKNLEQWGQKNPERKKLWTCFQEKTLPKNLQTTLLQTVPEKADATRNISGVLLQKIAELVPNLVGGSADLEPSTKTLIKNSTSIRQGEFAGRNIHFGVREHGMGAIVNGLAYTGEFIPYAATFLMFADYMRPAIRLAALAGLQSIFIFTHDSVFLGEDGPTHQPVEHLTALRAIPNLQVLRPADGIETAMAWTLALQRKDGPTCLILTRQKVPNIERSAQFQAEQIKRGAYIVREAKNKQPQLTLIGTGSELHLCMQACEPLEAQGIATCVVSMPSMELFLKQPPEYRKQILPTQNCRFVVIETGVTWGWYRIVKHDSLLIGHDTFGMSAPAEDIAEELGFTGKQVAEKILRWWRQG